MAKRSSTGQSPNSTTLFDEGGLLFLVTNRKPSGFDFHCSRNVRSVAARMLGSGMIASLFLFLVV